MKKKINCPTCSAQTEFMLTHEISFNVTCHNRHDFTVINQSNQFEIFFDLGCIELIEGYHHHAVFNFSLAFEKFREYIIKFYLAEKFGFHEKKRLLQIDESSVITEIWEGLKMQSERQIGAYMVIYALKYRDKINPYSKNTLRKLIQKTSEFRNKVIHQGDIPKAEETNKYGKDIFYHIIELYRSIDVDKILLDKMQKILQYKNLENNKNHNITIAFPGFQFSQNKNCQDYSFEKKIKDMRDYEHNLF